PDFEVHLIHLVRDSRGVAWSKSKALAEDARGGVQADLCPAPVAATARRWLLTNLVCSYLSRELPARYRRLRYEDFVADPGATLRQIGGLHQLDLAETIRKVNSGETLKAGHVVAGNRLRMSDRLRIRPDLEWEEKLGAEQEAAVLRWTGWLLHRYG